MMTFIKIVFVILLLIPIALLMRYFVSRLSREVPRQAFSPMKSRAEKKAEKARKKAEKNDRNKKNKGSGKDKNQAPLKTYDKPSENRASHRPSEKEGYTPRQPKQWERSERVPFGEAEGYKVRPEKRVKPSDAVRRREGSVNTPSGNDDTEEIAFAEDKKEAKKPRKKNRSDKLPTKRQLRKNRERARKRDLKMRKKERKQEGKDR